MRLLSKCVKIVYQGRCGDCGSLVELTKEEYELYPKDRPTCPSCGEVLCLVLKSISKFYVNEEGAYSRG